MLCLCYYILYVKQGDETKQCCCLKKTAVCFIFGLLNKRKEKIEMAGKKSSFNLMNVVSVLVIAVVLGLGIWAVSGTISGNLETNRLSDTSNWKIADYADQAGMSVDEYIALCCKVIQHTAPSIAIERFVSQSPDNLLISPRWGLKNYEFTNLLNNQIKKLGIKQGESLNS